MTQPGIELCSPGLSMNTLLIQPMAQLKGILLSNSPRNKNYKTKWKQELQKETDQ